MDRDGTPDLRRFLHQAIIAAHELQAKGQEAKVLVEDYNVDYNGHRPHRSLDYMTLAAFAASCAAAPRATLGQPRHTKEHSTQLS